MGLFYAPKPLNPKKALAHITDLWPSEAEKVPTAPRLDTPTNSQRQAPCGLGLRAWDPFILLWILGFRVQGLEFRGLGIPWELWCYSVLRPCRIVSINSMIKHRPLNRM